MPSILSGNPLVRQYLYAGFWLTGLILGALAVAFGSMSAGIPEWFTVATSVYAFLGAAVGYTAQSNVGNPAQP